MTALASSLDREDRVQAPWDLRLLPGAAGMWTGAITGLLGTGWTPAAVLLAAGALALLVRRRTGWRAVSLLGVVAALALTLAGWTVARLAVDAATSDPLRVAAGTGMRVEVVGTVTARPQLVGATAERSGQWWIRISAASAVIGGTAVTSAAAVTVRTSEPEWAAVSLGSRISFAGTAHPDDFGVVSAVVIRVRGSPVVLDGPPWWLGWSDSVAVAVRQQAADLGQPAEGLLPGLVLGETSSVPDELTTAAQATGLTHLLAVSGSHFAVVCGLVVVVLGRFGPRVAAAGGTVVMAGLVVLVGPQASVVRAAAMAAVAMLALLTGRARSALPALFTAVIVLLVVDPALALSYGFALSVAATGALVTLAPTWSAALQDRGVPAGWADLVSVPVAAAVVTAPLVAMLSSAVSLMSVPANILVAPVVVPALLLGLACAVLAPWWPSLAAVPAWMTEPLLRWIAGVARTLARWPGAAVPWSGTVAGAVLLGFVLLGSTMALRNARVRVLALGVILAVIAGRTATWWWSPGWPPDGWRVVICSVGQGTAAVVRTEDPASALVFDTGPDPSAMAGCLADLEITAVPVVLLTHLHADHIGGLPGVLDQAITGSVVLGEGARDGPALDEVLRQAATAEVPVRRAVAGDVLEIDGARIDIVGPPREVALAGNENDGSVVALVTVSGIRVLITGDAEELGQRAILRAPDLHVDVLIQPHHGSGTFLPALLDHTSPRVSLIGVGAANDYGHPAPSVLKALGDRGITIGRTDLDGDVAVTPGPDGGPELTLIRRGNAA